MARRSIILLCMSVFLLSSATNPLAEELGAIYDTGKQGQFISVDVDGDGDIHLCYRRNSSVRYLRQVSGVWQSELLVNGSTGQTGTGFYPHFDVDSSENAHFVFTPDADGPIKYTRYNASNGTWSTVVDVITDSVSGSDTNRNSVSVCPNGDVFVIAQSDWGIRWNYKASGGNWIDPSSQLYTNNPNEPGKPHVCCGPNNRAVAIYGEYWHTAQSNQYIGLNQSKADPTAGWLDHMAPGGQLGGIPGENSLLIDENNEVHLVWLQYSPSELFNNIGYLHRNGPNYNSPWDSPISIYYQPIIVGQDPQPTPVIARTHAGDMLVVFARYQGAIKDVRYLLKENGQDWPTGYSLFNPPPQITNLSAQQLFPGVAADPRTDRREFVVGWEDSTGSGLGYVKVRRIILTQPIVPALSTVAASIIILVLSCLVLLFTREQRSRRYN